MSLTDISAGQQQMQMDTTQALYNISQGQEEQANDTLIDEILAFYGNKLHKFFSGSLNLR